MALTSLQEAVLSVVERQCSKDSGYCTGEIAASVGRQPGSESNRQHSALVSLILHELEVLGHVHRLDDKTPIVWCSSAKLID